MWPTIRVTPAPTNIVWVLRGEPEGWRVVGMVSQVYADQPPLILNFEDPDDMPYKKQLLDEAESGKQAAGEPGRSVARNQQAKRAAELSCVANANF